jgi:hypothetical protein
LAGDLGRGDGGDDGDWGVFYRALGVLIVALKEQACFLISFYFLLPALRIMLQTNTSLVL